MVIDTMQMYTTENVVQLMVMWLHMVILLHHQLSDE